MWKNPYQMIFENNPTRAFSKERFRRLWAAFPVCGAESVSPRRPGRVL